MPRYAPDDSRLVRIGRFLNVLDDADNKLSPTKVNVWASVIAAFSTSVGVAFAWIAGHLQGAEVVIGGAAGWLTHAFSAHYYDKKSRRDKPE